MQFALLYSFYGTQRVFHFGEGVPAEAGRFDAGGMTGH